MITFTNNQRICNKIRAALLLINSQGRAAHYTDIYRALPEESPDTIGRRLREHAGEPGAWKAWTAGYWYLPGTAFEEQVVKQLNGKLVCKVSLSLGQRINKV